MLKIEHLTKRYGEKAAVDDLTLHIAPGELCAFIGHNGAGKTTTLKACCGLLQFDEGEIYVDGVSLKDDPIECKRRLAYIPDNPDLYEYMTGIKYLNFVCDVFGVAKESRETEIHRYTDMFSLTADLAQPISAYSHGMKQKISVIGALVHNPKLWVLDEPLTGLDPQSAYQLKLVMKRHAQAGNTVFFSSHILDVVENLCDRCCIIKKGQLQGIYDLAELRAEGRSLEEIFMRVIGETEGETV